MAAGGLRRCAARRASQERRWRDTGPCPTQPDIPRLTSLHLKMIFTTYKSDVRPAVPRGWARAFGSRYAVGADPVARPGVPVGRAGVAQWQSASLPSWS
jgi:hypothetical protein